MHHNDKAIHSLITYNLLQIIKNKILFVPFSGTHEIWFRSIPISLGSTLRLELTCGKLN